MFLSTPSLVTCIIYSISCLVFVSDTSPSYPCKSLNSHGIIVFLIYIRLHIACDCLMRGMKRLNSVSLEFYESFIDFIVIHVSFEHQIEANTLHYLCHITRRKWGVHFSSILDYCMCQAECKLNINKHNSFTHIDASQLYVQLQTLNHISIVSLKNA